jgi:hypothetical protein
VQGRVAVDRFGMAYEDKAHRYFFLPQRADDRL